jgi:EAL domain-containing protein (putative c-di-GMP-specific phosphodiesterase class I)
MDGVQVLAELSRLHCTAKIIITSGMSSRVLEAAARSGNERGLNIIGVLAKPFSIDALRVLLAGPTANPQATSAPGYAPPAVDAAGSDAFHPTALELRQALVRDEFRPVYQPKIECATGRLAGFEALARWNLPVGRIVMPDHFIPLLEQEGLIDALTEAVLNHALPWFAKFSSVEPAADTSLSINFSSTSFKDSKFLERLGTRCRELGVAPERIVVELTETASMDESVVSLDLTTRLRMQGFQLSIDDFGKGYSSLLQLIRLPFSEIKIDKSFVSSATRSAESRTVVESIVRLGRGMGLKSVAEGVENLETFEYLKRIGCNIAQGYALGMPMNGAAIYQWVEARTPAP